MTIVRVRGNAARHAYRGRACSAAVAAHVRLRRRGRHQGVRLRDREALRGLAGIGVGHRHRVGTEPSSPRP